ncbi:DUF1192 domain-containing protein [Azospirillum sp. RWY-5-1]|uniref:DUF1192 domain-containing protein n=1 Tax=Azospirillum oleiclasticum TaxID=2735135 RepID=A0ABX2T5T1_9PROT|nr:DUF1192 domain-containing protein [Azospirillum oleiclasticum]NYZ12409.1 DUF1192 domain-containing protein [Azospirillum oleiclasticum]NYZ19569.1 DUF1192 domain-containing protein [Azospirillum oleiclasticum]
MDTDDLEPRKKMSQKTDLTGLSVEELQDYIAGLEGEILRARAMIDSKQAQKNLAETFFKR